MNKKIQLLLGDCLKLLKTLPDCSVDAVVTDPPYGLKFMGRSWDYAIPGVEIWAECLRVLKPGGHLLSFSGTRTYHRMAVAIEDAEFEIRDMIEWVYGSGFPKSLNIGKKVDQLQGNEREKIYTATKTSHKQGTVYGWAGGNDTGVCDYTKGSSAWEGWGTALKPSHEPICMARKPLSEKTVAENCLKWGTGGINIDESRIEGQWEGHTRTNSPDTKQVYGDYAKITTEQHPQGRFPANLIHDNSEEVTDCFPERKTGSKLPHHKQTESENNSMSGKNYARTGQMFLGDEGNASRFFKSIIYQAKASRKDRGQGNNHPTVKPTELMEYLIKMVSRAGQTVLDPYMGSGSTGVACQNTGRAFVGIEKEEQYFRIAEKRIQPD